ncbi:MAG: RNA polymerase sigma factor [Bacteroidota bacterium]
MNPFLKKYITHRADEELIEQAKTGDRSALEELLMKHQPYIYNIAWKMVRNPDDAADLTQEALIKVTINLGKFKFKSTFRTWVYRIVVNHFLSAEKRKGEQLVNGFDDMANNLNMTPDQELNEVEKKEYSAYIREMNLMCMSGMLLCLNKEQRMIYIIGEMFSANHNIGSEIMGISKENFRAKLSKSRKDLFNFMNNQCGLVNKSNPCRCHKKVGFALDQGFIDSKNLLYNRKEYTRFQEHIEQDADQLMDFVDQKYTELYQNMTFKKDFDKQVFIREILDDIEVKNKLNLN